MDSVWWCAFHPGHRSRQIRSGNQGLYLTKTIVLHDSGVHLASMASPNGVCSEETSIAIRISGLVFSFGWVARGSGCRSRKAQHNIPQGPYFIEGALPYPTSGMLQESPADFIRKRAGPPFRDADSNARQYAVCCRSYVPRWRGMIFRQCSSDGGHHRQTRRRLSDGG